MGYRVHGLKRASVTNKINTCMVNRSGSQIMVHVRCKGKRRCMGSVEIMVNSQSKTLVMNKISKDI